jgi:ParB family transcriptional regulator, chromosome partitioning protein
MSKLDEMRRTSGGSISESMGGGRTPAVAIPGEYRSGPAPPPLKMQGVKRRGDVSDIPVAKIGTDPDQPRKFFDDEALDRLAESLKTRGQLQPIRVRWSEGRGEYIVIVGERRYQAAVKAGLPTLACVVVEGEIPPGELLSIQLVENCLREDLRPMEQARAFRALMDSNGWNQSRLGEELRITQSAVAKALASLDLPAAVQEMVDKGDLDRSKAYELSKLDEPAEQVAVAERVVAEGLSRDETAQVVKKKAESKTAGKIARASGDKGRGATKGKPAKLPTERIIKTSAGIKIVASARKGFDEATWAEALKEALEQVTARLEPAEQGGEQAAA